MKRLPDDIMRKLARYFASKSFPTEEHQKEAYRLVENMSQVEKTKLIAMTSALLKKSKVTILC